MTNGLNFVTLLQFYSDSICLKMFFAQLVEFLNRGKFNRIVAKYNEEKNYISLFTYRQVTIVKSDMMLKEVHKKYSDFEYFAYRHNAI